MFDFITKDMKKNFKNKKQIKIYIILNYLIFI